MDLMFLCLSKTFLKTEMGKRDTYSTNKLFGQEEYKLFYENFKKSKENLLRKIRL
jgi:hypothetical protein